MSVYAYLKLAFNANKDAQAFSDWLFHNGYTNKELWQNTVSVTLPSHGDRVVVLEEAQERGADILEDDVEDDY
jgi:hypothetical protein